MFHAKIMGLLMSGIVIGITGCGTHTQSNIMGITPNVSAVVKNISIPSNPKPIKSIVYPMLSLGAQDKVYVLRLQVMLTKLGYLPLTLTSSSEINNVFIPKYNDIPGLNQQWVPGKFNQMTRGGVLTFQEASNLVPDGVVGPATWKALLKATSDNTQNPFGYTYIDVSKTQPEKLTVWKNGKIILTSLVNTGIVGAATPNGTWPIYQRYVSQTMHGTMPDGVSYVDPGIPWVNYFYLGDAVHGYPRASYGFPQSNGCVELPINMAKRVYQDVHYGTLVTVMG